MFADASPKTIPYVIPMPAVDLNRLKHQIDGLIWMFTRPVEFVQELHDIFSFYADRVYKPGELIQKKSSIQSYHVPSLVMRQLEIDLHQRCIENPGAALSLIDALWQESMLEPRILAATLLGLLPLNYQQDISSRLVSWSGQTTDDNLLRTLLEKGTSRLQQEKSEDWIQILKEWGASEGKGAQRAMLYSILSLLQNPEYENLPPLFDLTAIAIKSHPQALQRELIEVTTLLKERSSSECAYFLRQIIRLGVSEATARLLRKIIALFDEPVKSSLLAEWRTSSAQPK
jgi:hypothetical protein